MNPIKRAAYGAILKLVEVSLGNHFATVTIEGEMCATCRPLQPWPCEHYVKLGSRAAELRSELEAAG